MAERFFYFVVALIFIFDGESFGQSIYVEKIQRQPMMHRREQMRLAQADFQVPERATDRSREPTVISGSDTDDG